MPVKQTFKSEKEFWDFLNSFDWNDDIETFALYRDEYFAIMEKKGIVGYVPKEVKNASK